MEKNSVEQRIWYCSLSFAASLQDQCQSAIIESKLHQVRVHIVKKKLYHRQTQHGYVVSRSMNHITRITK